MVEKCLVGKYIGTITWLELASCTSIYFYLFVNSPNCWASDELQLNMRTSVELLQIPRRHIKDFEGQQVNRDSRNPASLTLCLLSSS